MYTFDTQKLSKMDEMIRMGHPMYPHDLHVTHSLQEATDLTEGLGVDDLALMDEHVIVAGRMMWKNHLGKIGFARIVDSSGKIQVSLKRDVLSEMDFALWKKLDVGDHIWVQGVLTRTNTGEPTVRADRLVLASKCMGSMPDRHNGIADVEFKYRHRYVDLIIDEDSRKTLIMRSKIVRWIRRFMEGLDFLEVETPMMQTIPGGASARPFITHHNALDIPLYMRIAPELYLKRLVVGGLDRVFEINRNFRNEGMDTSHNPEFTMMELYQTYTTWEDLMDMTERMFSLLASEVCGSMDVMYGDHTIAFGGSWRRVSMGDSIAEITGVDVTDVEAMRSYWMDQHPRCDQSKLPTTIGRWYELYFDEYVEHTLIQPTFITRYPIEISPLSRRSDSDPEYADRFELFIAGREIANGFNELNDPVDQAERFTEQAAQKGDESMHFDADYIHALTYGLPPCAGEGIGIDRLVMLLTNSQSIRDVILFPTMRPVRS